MAATVPTEHRLHRFKWLFQDEQLQRGRAGQRADRAARLHAVRRRGAVRLRRRRRPRWSVSQPLWAEPPDAMKKLVPNYPLMWAMFGVARLPSPGDSLRGLADGETHAPGSTPTPPTRCATCAPPASRPGSWPRCARRGKVVGRAETTLDSAGRAAHRPARRAERAGQARPDLPLDRAGRLCAGDLDCSQAVGCSPRCSSPPA